MKPANRKSIKRARKTIKCLGFNLKFYKDIQEEGLNAGEVFSERKKYLTKASSTLNKPNKIEDDFLWLITIGILRREVDGQGLTSRVRLTPLGRQVIEECPQLADQKPNAFEKVTQFFFRKMQFR
tara:strand:+ start:570 stop:944 length:375 start_codon:yes stop_codon:yes gene_type:complete